MKRKPFATYPTSNRKTQKLAEGVDLNLTRSDRQRKKPNMDPDFKYSEESAKDGDSQGSDYDEGEERMLKRSVKSIRKKGIRAAKSIQIGDRCVTPAPQISY